MSTVYATAKQLAALAEIAEVLDRGAIAIEMPVDRTLFSNPVKEAAASKVSAGTDGTYKIRPDGTVLHRPDWKVKQ